MLSGLEQRDVFGAKFFLQFAYLPGQLLSFPPVFLLVGLVELITEIEDLAISLDFDLIATDDADDLLCQFGSIGLLSLSKQRRRRNNQNPQDQQPVHGFPSTGVKRSFQWQRVSSLKSLEHRFCAAVWAQVAHTNARDSRLDGSGPDEIACTSFGLLSREPRSE